MKTYGIHDILPLCNKNPTDYYVGIFEDTEDPDMERNHRHSYYSIVWFTQGSGLNVIDFNEYEIRPNRIFMIGPREIHNWSYSVDSRGYFVIVEEPLAEQLNLSFHVPFIDISDLDSVFMKEIFRRILQADIPPQGQFKQDTIAISYLCSLVNNRNFSKARVHSALIGFKKLITDDYESNFTIAQCAKELNISSEELTRICREETGLSPKQLQLDLKITEIKRLLLYTPLNAMEIAFQTGFEDTSYFSRIFKKKTGHSPSAFREKYLNLRQKS